MSDRRSREGALTQASPPKGISIKREFLWPLVVALLFVGFEVGIRHVPPDAVQVSVSYVESGRIYFSREITDARTVADGYARANALRAPSFAELNGTYTCALYDPHTVEQYTLRFTRWGLPVMVATDVNRCGSFWHTSSGFPGSWFPSVDSTGGMRTFLIQIGAVT
jgi:hypothetical protein